MALEATTCDPLTVLQELQRLRVAGCQTATIAITERGPIVAWDAQSVDPVALAGRLLGERVAGTFYTPDSPATGSAANWIAILAETDDGDARTTWRLTLSDLP